jgi:acetyl esterase/lipase
MSIWRAPVLSVFLAAMAGECTPPVPPYRLTCPSAGCASARGLVIVIHGGGWQDEGGVPNDSLTTSAEQRWVGRSWASVAVGYRSSTQGPLSDSLKDLITALTPAGAEPKYPAIVSGSARYSIDDTRYFYAHLSEILGPELAAKPRCVVGFSAGAHLALMVAAQYHDIGCVVADAGPTNLVDSPIEPNDADPRELRWIAGAYAQLAFGAPGPRNDSGLRAPELSPTNLAAQGAFAPTLEILIGGATNDPFVGPGHLRDFLSARPTRTQAVLLTPSSATGAPAFVHSTVTPSSLAAYRTAEAALAARVAGQ